MGASGSTARRIYESRGLDPAKIERLLSLGLTQAIIAERFGVEQGSLRHFMRVNGIRSARSRARQRKEGERAHVL